MFKQITQDEIDSLIKKLNYEFVVKDVEEIKDAVFDSIFIFIKKYASHDDLDKSKMLSIIYKIAKNILYKNFRKIKMTNRFIYNIREIFYDTKRNDFEIMDKENNIKKIIDIILKFKTSDLEIILWHYFYSLRFKEIAKMKNKTESSIQKQHSRLIKRISDEFTPP